LKAIQFYGEAVGQKVKKETLGKGLDLLAENYQQDLPSLRWKKERVVVEGEWKARVHVCHLANVWKELGVPEIGRLYCSMLIRQNIEPITPNLECIHVKNVLEGDSSCEIAVRPKRAKDNGKSLGGDNASRLDDYSVRCEQNKTRKEVLDFMNSRSNLE
jgi:hypothetical protein